MRLLHHLVCSPSMYNGFDEDPQILSCLSGLVPFEADAKPRRAGVIKRHLEHKMLLSTLRNKALHTGCLLLLGEGERVKEVKVERIQEKGDTQQKKTAKTRHKEVKR